MRQGIDKANLEKHVRHGLGFLISGTFAFCVDAAILQVLTGYFGIDPILARVGSISVAMVAGWLAHRRLTFNVVAPPSVAEFVRYAAVAWFSAAVNYVVFVLIILLWPEIPVLGALFVSGVVQMFVSYVGMRFAAFRVPSH